MWPSKKNKELVERVVLRTGDVINRRYKINKVLGEGSFGTVYKVDDLRLQQASALKVLRLYDVPPDNRPELCDRFRKEYSTGRINCNCLVHSLEYREIKGNPYIVMEFCPGGDLNPYLGNADGQAVSICYDLLTGLNALHTHGIVHRDLKPENILFKSDGHAALTDFGIVGDQNDNMTKIGANLRPKDIFGTHAYMAPEQRNRARWGVTRLTTSDMFSFGVLTYQLLTGRLPFGRLDTYDDLPAYVERAEKGQWDKAPLKYIDQGASWQRLINACLQPDYTKRIGSAADAVAFLPQRPNKREKLRPLLSTSYKPAMITHGFRLRILNGQEQGRIYDLNLTRNGHPATLFRIGRNEDNDIIIRNDYNNYLSRHHCTIEAADRSGKQWLVRDGHWDKNTSLWQPSRNGTYVNSRPVKSIGYYLQPGDIITISDVTLRFENY